VHLEPVRESAYLPGRGITSCRDNPLTADNFYRGDKPVMTQPASPTSHLPCVDILFDHLILAGALPALPFATLAPASAVILDFARPPLSDEEDEDGPHDPADDDEDEDEDEDDDEEEDEEDGDEDEEEGEEDEEEDGDDDDDEEDDDEEDDDDEDEED
jgi:hypothetical protein